MKAHPAHPPARVSAIEARVIGFDADWLRVRWRIEDAHSLVVPAFAGRGRADELWRATCFELFLRPVGGEAYVELNLSPSERWAAYEFTGYRDGMSDRPASREPDCTMRQGSSFAIFDAAIPRDVLPALPASANFTAVIEEHGGVVSYWAITHPEAKPDFHDQSCFVAELAPPRRA
ncbi:DOMON-like domain-containing protein [Tsuneonella deserti]|uniref:DOMON-like domain-containing protein n=1 Tax=Tsuneonella deserti TaxID=2035528 RepID=UPI0027E4C296|nr:DOMON-like domain-containing protein [Tsuneonella deserti]